MSVIDDPTPPSENSPNTTSSDAMNGAPAATNGVAGHSEPSADSSAAATLECQLEFAQHDGLAANLERQLAFIGAFEGAKGVVELQALKVKNGRYLNNYSVFADSSGNAVMLCADPDLADAQGIYLLTARLRPGVESRAPKNDWQEMRKGEGTTDSDIAARTVLPMDLDVQRPSNTSATDEEMAKSVEVALRCWSYLASIIGEDSMAYVHSGNGRQIHVALDSIPESKEVYDLVKGILGDLDARSRLPK